MCNLWLFRRVFRAWRSHVPSKSADWGQVVQLGTLFPISFLRKIWVHTYMHGVWGELHYFEAELNLQCYSADFCAEGGVW